MAKSEHGTVDAKGVEAAPPAANRRPWRTPEVIRLSHLENALTGPTAATDDNNKGAVKRQVS